MEQDNNPYPYFNPNKIIRFEDDGSIGSQEVYTINELNQMISPEIRFSGAEDTEILNVCADEHLLQLNDADGNMMVRVEYDGSVAWGDAYLGTSREAFLAAQTFWLAIGKAFPGRIEEPMTPNKWAHMTQDERLDDIYSGPGGSIAKAIDDIVLDELFAEAEATVDAELAYERAMKGVL